MRERIKSGQNLNASEIREFRLYSTALGATPTSRSQIAVPQGDDDCDNPFAQFFCCGCQAAKVGECLIMSFVSRNT
ncbi:MAG: hypothetical protein HKN63_07605 [Rhodobacteraceae bacterium]|nr:hypothetical protein [Paracoccaceae bacterium]